MSGRMCGPTLGPKTEKLEVRVGPRIRGGDATPGKNSVWGALHLSGGY